MKWLLPLLLLLLQACAPGPTRPTAAYEPPPPPPQPERQYTGGSIWQQGFNRTLFEDGRARQVGDVITIRLEERTSARKQQDTSTSRKTDVAIQNATLFGRAVQDQNTPLLANTLASENAFEGTGASSQSNQLTGTITATVTKVYPNGLMEIRGQKWLRINQGEEYVRISGLVRERDIAADNSISSTRIANARIAYSGKGTLAEANRPGWLARFFNSVIWPF